MERKTRTSETHHPRRITKADHVPVVGDLTNADFIRVTGLDWQGIVATFGRGNYRDNSRSRFGGNCDVSYRENVRRKASKPR